MATGRGLLDHCSRLRARVLGNAGQSIFVLNRAHPVRARPIRGDERAVRLHTTSGICRGILIVLASGVALGSWLAAAFLIAVSLPFLLYRTITEDRVLQRQLPGYADYARRV